MQTWQQRMRAHWTALGWREKNMVLIAAAVVAAGLVIAIGISPAVGTLRSSKVQQAQLDRQLQQMLVLQERVQAAKAQPPVDQSQAVAALRASLGMLGQGAQLSVNDERASLTLQGVRAEALAEWLARARTEARAVPLEARLSRSEGQAEVGWDGTMVMSLPPR